MVQIGPLSSFPELVTLMPSKPRPNILIFMTDQQRWDSLKLNGNRLSITPNLDQLMAESINFDHCFVQSPLCMPSRVSFLSGRYPSSTGILSMGVPVPQSLRILPHYFSGSGYRVASLGKLHFLPHANRDHRELHPSYGFDRLEVSDEPGVYEDSYRAWVRRQDPTQLDHLSFGLPPATHTWYTTMGLTDMVNHPAGTGPREDFGPPIPFPGDSRYTHTAFVAEQTIDFLHGQPKDLPFVCIASFFAPHAPWVVPKEYLDLYNSVDLALLDGDSAEVKAARLGYFAMLSEIDHHVGRVISTLTETAHLSNTVIVFISDHGEWLGDSGRFGKGYPGDDPVSRVPFFVRMRPEDGVPPIRCSELVEAVDVLPSLLSISGLPIPPSIDGVSLGEILLGRPQVYRDSALMEFEGWKSLRTKQYRYVIHKDGTEHLWHAEDDANINTDLTSQDGKDGIVSELRHQLLQRIMQSESSLARTWPY